MGYAHPDILLEQLTSSQITEWWAYDTVDPIGERRDDYRFSYMFSLLTNLVIRATGKKNAKLTKVDDFLFKWNAPSEKQKQTVEEMTSRLLAFAKTNKLKVVKKENI